LPARCEQFQFQYYITNIKLDARSNSSLRHTHTYPANTGKHGASALALLKTAPTSRTIAKAPHTSTTNSYTSKNSYGIHNTKRLTWNLTFHCPYVWSVNEQRSYGGNLSLHGRPPIGSKYTIMPYTSFSLTPNGGRSITITADFENRPIKSFTLPLPRHSHPSTTTLIPQPTCTFEWSTPTKVPPSTPRPMLRRTLETNLPTTFLPHARKQSFFCLL
jgi:hypothetical protein